MPSDGNTQLIKEKDLKLALEEETRKETVG